MKACKFHLFSVTKSNTQNTRRSRRLSLIDAWMNLTLFGQLDSAIQVPRALAGIYHQVFAYTKIADL